MNYVHAKDEYLNINQKNEYKKRGDWFLPVPHTEALRLPCQSERATYRPHAGLFIKVLMH